MSSINRKPHCLLREKTLAIPRHLLFFDIETTQEVLSNGSTKQHFKLGWACYYHRAYGRNLEHHEWCYFDNIREFWHFVFKHTAPKQKLWVLARNLVFDFTIAGGWKYLREGGFKLKFFHNAGCTSIISVRSKGGSIVFLDIMNWFVESLAKTGERIGIPKLKIDFETCTDEYLSIYCKRDVEVEVENFKRFASFLQTNSISRLCYTRGSTAMAAYLFRHYTHKIWIHNNAEAIALERESYKGGRTECFYIGDLRDENYYMVDVNSLYPFVMRNNQYPAKYKALMHKVDVKTLHTQTQNHSVVAKVLIDTDEPVYAVRRGRTIFPVGTFTTVLTTPEIVYAIEHNHIVSVDNVVVYEQANLFRSYVDKFYRMKREFKAAGIAEYTELCKKMLNSLYGKFGQKADVWEKIGECPDEPDRVELLFVVGEHRTRQIRYLLGEIFELVGYEECFNSFPAIASHVAAFARLYLWSLMKEAGEGNYFYCDTDSLIVNEAGLCNLQNRMDTERLGSLRIESKLNRLTIRGLKDYSTETKQVVKGIRKNAVELSTGVYEQEQWPSFRGVLRSTNPDEYVVKKITKVLHREYVKGVVNPDGSVVPLVLSDGEDAIPRLL